MRFANNFHSWLRHSRMLLANCLTRDPKIVIHGNSCIILYIISVSRKACVKFWQIKQYSLWKKSWTQPQCVAGPWSFRMLYTSEKLIIELWSRYTRKCFIFLSPRIVHFHRPMFLSTVFTSYLHVTEDSVNAVWSFFFQQTYRVEYIL